MSSCIFCRIIEKTIPAKIVYEDDQIVAFYDLYPKAPVHLLVVPKLHIESMSHVEAEHAPLLGHLMTKIPLIAHEHGLNQGFRTIINTGPIGGQEVYHIHAHILGGQTPLPLMIAPTHRIN